MRGKASVKSMRQLFHPCAPDFIANICHASCCRSSTDPTGIAVTVTGPTEAQRIEGRGGTVDRRTWRIQPVNKRCPFQHPETHLCTIHDDDEPFGCIASPFTITNRGTLIVRNRYRLLRCYRAPGAIEVYRAHRRSLDIILGSVQAGQLAAYLDTGGTDDYPLDINDHIAGWLLDKSDRSKPGEVG